MATLVQVRLSSGSMQRTCWLDRGRKFKLGDAVTLKNSENRNRLWTVDWISQPRDAKEIHTDWHNNI